MTLVLLDRDGTLNVDQVYGVDVEKLEFMHGALDALSRLKAYEIPVAVVTNQSGIARGLFTETQMHEFHHEIQRRVEAIGGTIQAFYHCPHGALAKCDCRKPKPGLLLKAAQEMGVRPEETYMIGDSWRDVAAGRAAGTRTILVTQKPRLVLHEGYLALGEPVRPNVVVPNLLDAVRVVLMEAKA